LRLLLGAIERALRERTASIAEVSDMLAQLGDRLVKHFALEEQEGYFGDALLRAPQLVAKANQLLAQHPLMCGCVSSLLQEAQSAPEGEDWWDRTERLFLAFRDELLRHERQEDRLLLEAYGQDIGSHD
jgi:hypothetical protein